MGFLGRFDGTTRIDLGDGFYVDIKKSLTVRESEEAERALINVRMGDNGKAETKADTYAHTFERVCASVVAWNLTDENDNPLPLAPDADKRESLQRLPRWAYDLLAKEVNAANAAPSKEEAVSFPTGS